MGTSKRHQRYPGPQRQTRTRTRQNKGTILLSDPAQNTHLLTVQLREMGLYAANTLGDGNCLFRALSDQYYGSPSQHLNLRKEICDWIAAHRLRYEPFVDDDRGLDDHLRCMRQQGTYGGHLELSAFAHLKRRNVKVIQPGLVYVIEWAGGGEPGSPKSPVTPRGPNHSSEESNLSERERRHLRREIQRDKKQKTVKVLASSDDDDGNDDDDDSTLGAVYVAYHDWEHFSSVRNLSGPHSGLPTVVERPAVLSNQTGTSRAGVDRKKSISRKMGKGSSTSESKAKESSVPTCIPLPPSRSISPSPYSEASASGSSAVSLLTAPVDSLLDGAPTGLPNLVLRINRSPKRTFDESSGTSSQTTDMSQGSAKRSRSGRRRLVPIDADADPDADTPSLLASGSSPDSTSSSSVPSPAPTPPPTLVKPSATGDRPLTRRQRKALGLPKPRGDLPGKIIIPGGRYKKSDKIAVKNEDDVDDSATGEWATNGSGRLDVRGFRELKI